MVGARDRRPDPFGADVPEAAGAVLQPLAQAPYRLGGRVRARRAARLSGLGRGLTAFTMRILLTGSSGWLGRFLAPRLREEGHEVVGLDIAPGADTDIIGSVADKALIDGLFASRGIEA